MNSVPCRTLTAGRRTWRLCPDAPPLAADRLRAVLGARLFDELTGNGLTAELAIATETPGLVPRVAANGIAGLVGRPRRVLPDLSAAAVEVAMTVSAAGYLARRVSATLGPFTTGLGYPADWPAHFEPAELGDVPMHRSGVVLCGRVVLANQVPTQPAVNATVTVADLWHRFPAAHEDPLALIEPGAVLSLHPGLYRARTAPGATVTALDLAPAPAADKRLVAAAGAGVNQVSLSDVIDLNPGDLLGIEIGHPDLVEIIPIAAIGPGGATTDQPAVVTLDHPLALPHRAGTAAVRLLPQGGPAPANALRRDGITGDRLVFVQGLAGIPDAPRPVAITGGGAGPEVQTAARLRAVTNADGYYRLPILSRVAQLSLRAENGGLPQPIVRLLSPDYGAAEYRFDLIST